MRTLLIAVAISLLAGCVPTQAVVTYKTIPPGGDLSTNGRDLGYAPQTFYYTIDREDRARKYIKITSVNAAWVSGAKTQFIDGRELSVPKGTNQSNLYYTVILRRPDDAPNKELDLKFGLEYERNQTLAAQQRAAAAALNRSSRGSFEDDLIEAAFGYKGNSRTSEIIHEEALRESLRERTSTKCRSKRIYNGDYETVCE